MQSPHLTTHDSHLTMETETAGITVAKQFDHMTSPHHLVMEILVPVITVKQGLSVLCYALPESFDLGFIPFLFKLRKPLVNWYVLLHLGLSLLLGVEVEASANAVKVECMILFWFEVCNL